MLTPLAAESVRVDLQIDAMHNEFYTSMATQGWEMEMGKLAEIIESRRKMSALIPFLWFNIRPKKPRYYVGFFPAKMGEIQRFPAGSRGPEGSVMTAASRWAIRGWSLFRTRRLAHGRPVVLVGFPGCMEPTVDSWERRSDRLRQRQSLSRWCAAGACPMHSRGTGRASAGFQT